MEISIFNQLLTILNSVFIGMLSCVIYEIFMLARIPLIREYSSGFVKKMKEKDFGKIKNQINKEKRHKILKISIHCVFDFLYFIFLTPIYAIFFYETSNGIVRWYAFLFSLVGFFVFKKTVGRIIEKALEYIGFYLEISVSYIIYKIKMMFFRVFIAD